MDEPLVSVMVPVFNCERFIAQALDSIFDQDYDALDVIVVDDGSTDGSAAIASSYPVNLLRIAHGGIARARNAAVAAAKGELVAFLDADDIWTAGSLRRRVDYMVERPALDALFALADLFIEPGTPRPSWFLSAWEEDPQHSMLTGVMVRRHVFDRVGPFDPAYEIGEDTDWFARLKDAQVTYERLDEIVVRYRRHDSNTTNRRDIVGPNLLRIMKASIDRQRAAG
jgi:glycosyltransferase involved in cell wall biosynthesis